MCADLASASASDVSLLGGGAELSRAGTAGELNRARILSWRGYGLMAWAGLGPGYKPLN